MFVVRAGGGWRFLPLGGDVPMLVDLIDVVQLFGEDSGRAMLMSKSASDVADASAPEYVIAGAPFAGRVLPDGLEVDDGSGGIATLGVAHLEILDRIQPVAYGEDPDGGEEVAVVPGAALDLLLQCGLVRRSPHRQVPPDPVVHSSASATPARPAFDRRTAVAISKAAVGSARSARRALGERVNRIVAERVRVVPPTRSAAPSPPDPSVQPPAEVKDLQRQDRGEIEPAAPDHRVPVYSPWFEAEGPPLASGMLTAAARQFDGGVLNEHFEIRRPEAASSVLADLRLRSGPVLILCSNYVWTVADNLELLGQAARLNPDLFVIHGGPSSPKYEADAVDFLTEHRGLAHVLVRGEGEVVLCSLLQALADTNLQLDRKRFEQINGITFVAAGTNDIVRTGEPERIADLNSLPSPYLTGEFDHLPISAWPSTLAIETNRGCPYGCTYCDWGSVTLSRIRKFDLDRVAGEIEWAAERGVICIQFTDANFGIMSRDVEVANELADVKRRLGHPETSVICPAKNTTKHLVAIMDIFAEAKVSMAVALGVQTTDQTTLDAIDRSNISVESYVQLAAEHRNRGHALQGDLLLGLPGQTYESYRRDLQFMFDHEILVRTWPVQALPNSPMNAPEYRALHGIRMDERKFVISTTTFTEEDRARMLSLRNVMHTLEIFGVARHVLRWAQWDHGVAATEVMDHLLDVSIETPERFPHLCWTLRFFEHHPVAPASWSRFYDELRTLLIEDFGLPPSQSMDTVFAVNEFLMPRPNRSFPDSLELRHDYPAYFVAANRSLYRSGGAAAPQQRLDEFPAGVLTVDSDPLKLCTAGLHFHGKPGTQVVQSDFYLHTASANELKSPLMRLLQHVQRVLSKEEIAELIRVQRGVDDPDADDPTAHSVLPAMNHDGSAAPIRIRPRIPVSASAPSTADEMAHE